MAGTKSAQPLAPETVLKQFHGILYGAIQCPESLAEYMYAESFIGYDVLDNLSSMLITQKKSKLLRAFSISLSSSSHGQKMEVMRRVYRCLERTGEPVLKYLAWQMRALCRGDDLSEVSALPNGVHVDQGTQLQLYDFGRSGLESEDDGQSRKRNEIQSVLPQNGSLPSSKRSAGDRTLEVKCDVLTLLLDLESEYVKMMHSVEALYIDKVQASQLICLQVNLEFFYPDKFNQCSNVEGIFRVWIQEMSIFNIHTLRAISKLSRVTGALELVKEYEDKCNKFTSSTTIQDFKEAVRGHVPPPCPDGKQRLMLRLGDGWPDRTLKDLKHLTYQFFGVDSNVLVGFCVMSGSIVVSWLVPDSVASTPHKVNSGALQEEQRSLQASSNDTEKQIAPVKPMIDEKNVTEEKLREDITMKQNEVDNANRYIEVSRRHFSLLQSRLKSEKLEFDQRLRQQLESCEKMQIELMDQIHFLTEELRKKDTSKHLTQKQQQQKQKQNEQQLNKYEDCKEDSQPHFDADKKFTALMNKYKDQPTINYKSLKCSFIGPPHVGKTTTRKRLMEEIVNLSISGDTASESTQLQKPITVQLYEKTDIAPAVLGSSQWKMDDLLGEMQLLLQHIQREQQDPKKEHRVCPSDEAQDDPKPAKIPTSTPISVGNVPQARQKLLKKVEVKMPKSFPQRHRDGEARRDAGERSDHRQLLTFDYVEKMIKEVLEKKGLKDIQEMEETITAYIMDFGGQPEFQDVFPIVLRGAALHLVFFNASLSLNNPVHIKFCPQEGSTDSSIKYDTKYTMSEMLIQILSSLYCLSKNLGNVTQPSGEALPRFTPTAVLIGTHIDLNTSVDEVSHTLKVLLQDTEFWKKDFLRTPTSCSTVFQPLDNKNGNKEEIKHLQKFIKELIMQGLESTPMPTSWLLFHIALRHCYEKDGWCTMEQCVALAAQCNIPVQDVEPILEYIHHHIGNVLHYADVPDLRDKVFCDPNQLLEAINRIIILSFVGDPDYPNLSQEIRRTGEVPGKLLREIEAKAVGFSSITNKDVIILLKHYKTITEILGRDKIFVPCLLQPDTSIELASHDQLKDVNPPPLLIQFEGGYIPVSVFSGLAVALMSQHDWILRKKHRFRNHLRFVSSLCSIELIGHFHFLEVRICKGTEVLDCPSWQQCCLVKESFEVSIAYVLSLYEHTKKTSFALGFYCPCPLAVELKPHFCKLISGTRMMCSKTENIHFLGNRAIWFREPKCQAIEHTASTDSDKELADLPAHIGVLTIEQLVNVKQALGHFSHWQDLGLNLGLHYDLLEEIGCKQMVDERVYGVLYEWLSMSHAVDRFGPPTWGQLADAVEPINYSLANAIRKKDPDYW